jgi:hypothetical protein
MWWDSREAWDAHVLACGRECVVAVTPENIRTYAQGSYSLVEADLRVLAGPAHDIDHVDHRGSDPGVGADAPEEHLARVHALLAAHGVQAAFEVRRKLTD